MKKETDSISSFPTHPVSAAAKAQSSSWTMIAFVTMSPGGDAAAYWRARARRLLLTLRAARIVEAWSPLLLGAAIPGALVVLLARRQGLPGTPTLLLVGACILATLGATLWRERRRLPILNEALATLDARLVTHNRLVSAWAGVGAWPTPPPRPPHAVHWNLARAATPFLFAAALLWAAAAVPVSHVLAASPAAPPPALAEAQALLEELADEKLADEAALREWQGRLDEVKSRPSSAWYEHDTLEAADTLRDRLDSDIRELARDLEGAAASLEPTDGARDGADAKGAGQSQDGQAAIAKGRGLGQALRNLDGSALPPPRQLRDALRRAGAPGARTLTPQEAASLRDKLRAAAGACRMVAGPCPPGSLDCIVALGRDGSGPGTPQGDAPSRGPGTAALTIGPDPSTVQPGRTEGLSSRDLREAVPGDLAGMDWGAPATDDTANAKAPGGRAAPGQGGEAVWRQVFSPEERRVLGRYFK